MKIIKFSIILSVVLYETCAQKQGGRNQNQRNDGPNTQCSRSYSVDNLVFALQWPTSFCWTQQRCTRDVDQTRWSIHGLWPSKRAFGESPQYCCLSNRFDTRLMDSLRNQLLSKWKSVREDVRHDQFWRHEYNKHGSCAQRLSRRLSNQFHFFNTTLNLFDLYPIGDWLRKADIRPNNDRLYSLDDIHDAIETHLKARVRLECSLNPNPRPDSPSILGEVHICLDKNNLKPIDCQNRDDRQCFNPNIRSKSVLFPKH